MLVREAGWMSIALSGYFRDRVVAEIDGMTCRQAAARFGISASSTIRWRARVRAQGDVRLGPLSGDRRSGRIESHPDPILGLVDRQPDITLAELRAALAEQGVAVGMAPVAILPPPNHA